MHGNGAGAACPVKKSREFSGQSAREFRQPLAAPSNRYNSPPVGPINKQMKTASNPSNVQDRNSSRDEKVVNLAVYKIKKSLKSEGFDLITDKNGKLTLVLRMPDR